MKHQRIVALLVLLLLPAFASADQDVGPYLGLNVGQTKLVNGCTDTVGVVVTDCQHTATGVRLFGGYHVNQYFGLEAGYYATGKATASGAIAGSPFTADVKANLLDLTAVGRYSPTPWLTLFGDLGFAYWHVDESANVSGVGSASVSDNGWSPTFGIGAEFWVAQNIGLRLQAQKYKDIGNDSTTGKSDVNFYSVGVEYRF